MSGFSDPFDSTGTEAPAFGGGMPPQFYNNLLAFGAATMAGANARTPQGFLANGAGPLGPIGVGLQGAMANSQQMAKTRSELGLQQAQSANLGAEARMHGAQVSQMNQAMDLFNRYINNGSVPGLASGAPSSTTGADNSGTQTPGGPAPDKYATATPAPGPMADVVQQTASKYGVPLAIATWVGSHESGWNPNATNGQGTNQVNGAWQFKAGTAQQYGVADPTNFAQSTDGAMRYLRDLAIKNNGDWGKVIDQYGTTSTGQGAAADSAVKQGFQQYLNRVGLSPQAAAGTPSQSGATPAAAAQGGAPSPYQVAQAGAGPLPVPGQQLRAPLQMSPGMMPTAAPWNAGTALGNQAAIMSLNPYTAGFGKPLEAQSQKLLDLSTVAPAAAAKAAQTITTDRFGNRYQGNTYIGRGPEVKEVWNPQTNQFDWGDVGALGPDMQPVNGGAAQIAKPGPMQQEFAHKYGEELGSQFEKIDTDAAAAKDSNYLFDNLRNDSKTWQMGKFADVEGDARAWLSAVAGTFNIPTPELNQKLADYTAFNKSSGMLLRTAVHDTSSRAAVQEYSMIGKTLPVPTTSEEGFGQVADQWQGLNDFRLAKQKVKQGYMGNPQDFNVDFNSNVSPTAFMVNRMMQTPVGQNNFQLMMNRMQETPEGRQTVTHMMKGYNYAKQNRLFDDLPPASGPGQAQP